MRTHLIRSTALAATALAGVLSLTACGAAAADASAPSSSSAPSSASPSPASSSSPGASRSASQPRQAETDGEAGRKGVEQVCGTNDLSWKATSKTQAGGYIEISVKAKQGITCWLPGGYPVVAFGSDGTEAQPAEQAVGDQIKLSGATTAYAGVNPKTTNDDHGKELEEIIVMVSRDEAVDPVALRTGSILVDRPVVTNWHTSPADAVPGDGTNG